MLIGLLLIVLATFRWSATAGLYSLGLTLCGLGVFLARYPPRKKVK